MIRAERVTRQVAGPEGPLTLLDDIHLTVAPGESVAIVGASGSGKSTLFRALAGIWPFGLGRVTAPAEGEAMFLPQRPYLPLGPLRRVLAYPSAAESFSDAECAEALRAVGLDHLAGRLDGEESWTQRLSGGEQQRLALARVLLNRPRWLFLDEATASLDEAQHQHFHALLAEHLPGTAILAIAHREPPAGFFTRVLRLEGGRLG